MRLDCLYVVLVCANDEVKATADDLSWIGQVALWRYVKEFEDAEDYNEAWLDLVNMSKAAGVSDCIYDLTGKYERASMNIQV